MGLFEVGIALMNNNISSVLTNHQTGDNTMNSEFYFYLHLELLTYEQALDLLARKNEKEGKEWRMPNYEEIQTAMMRREEPGSLNGSINQWLASTSTKNQSHQGTGYVVEVWLINSNEDGAGCPTCTITETTTVETHSPKNQPRAVLFVADKED